MSNDQMTVGDLREKLDEFDEDKPVRAFGYEIGEVRETLTGDEVMLDGRD